MPIEATRDVNLSTMAIADKVSRHAQARLFAVQLSALQAEAEMCRCHFVHTGRSDPMPTDVVEHLSMALMVARSAYLAPGESTAEHHAYARARLADGYGQALLRDILAALLALNIHFQIRPDGLDREYMQSKRMLWRAFPAALSDVAQTPAVSLPVGATPYDVDQFIRSFFKDLEIPSNDEH